MTIELARDLPLFLFISWIAGLRLYAILFVLGYLGRSMIILPEHLQFLTSDISLVITFTIALIKMVVDKIPGLDSVWHLAQTYISIPIGIILILLIGQPLIFLLLGIMLLIITTIGKAALRLAVNVNYSNGYLLSWAEEALFLIGLYLVINQPKYFIIFVALMSLQSALAFFSNFAYFRGLHQFIYRIFTKSKQERINKP